MKNQKDNHAGSIIRAAREARGMSQDDLARRVGTKQQTIDKIESGTIKHSRYFPKIALELRIEIARLMPDLGSKVAGAQLVPESNLRSDVRDFPVHVAAQGGPGEIVVSSDAVAWELRPARLVGVSRAYGIIVVGESMTPEFWPGDIAFINPHLPPAHYVTCVFYAEGDGETRATIKHLLKWSERLWYVRQWNPPKGQKRDFSLPRNEWGKCHRVVGKYSK